MPILNLPFPSEVVSVPPLSDRLAHLYSRAILIRAVEEQLLVLFSQGRLHGTVHTCIGQEWVGVAVAEHLKQGDFVFSNHRCHGHFLARTDDVEGLIAEVMGKRTGVCGGRGGSQHLCRDGFFSNGIQGGIVPVSAGLALAQKLRGSNNLTAVFIGDGTLGEGAVYETLNVASRWKLPLLIVLENNLYSQSTRQQETLAGGIGARAEAFDVPAYRADTWTPDSLLSVVETCVERIRRQEGPVFLQIDTYRLMAHSKGDDDRDAEEIAGYRERDPIHIFQQHFPDVAAGFAARFQVRIDAAVAAADISPLSDPLSEACFAAKSENVGWLPASIVAPERSVALIRQSLERALQNDERVVLMGEDIESPYGGAFKVTQGLSHRFPDRVRNMPISESLIVGMGNGLALAGMIPV
ncbi:MAG: thiamine pyrophosphate-dependent enzyme, partial [Planctomycetaceae bacterium]